MQNAALSAVELGGKMADRWDLAGNMTVRGDFKGMKMVAIGGRYTYNRQLNTSVGKCMIWPFGSGRHF